MFQQKCTQFSGISKTSSYTYNLDKMIASLTYPSGRLLTYSYSNAQRTLSVTDSTSGVNYVFSAAVYAPPGSLASMILGKTGTFEGVTETFTHNNRLQLTGQLASSVNGTVLNLNYGFPSSPGNNGRGTSFTNNLDNGRSVSATYDPLNRLASAQSQATSGADCWGQSLATTVGATCPDWRAQVYRHGPQSFCYKRIRSPLAASLTMPQVT